VTPSQGMYDLATGVWMVGPINVNQSATLTRRCRSASPMAPSWAPAAPSSRSTG
jgi:hypothetical protein